MIERVEQALLQFFLRILPARWRRQLQQRPGFEAVFRSILHLASEKGVRLTVGIFTYALVVRHLGPVEYGRYSWVLNFITIFLPLVQYGLDETVSRDLVNAKDDLERTRTVLWGALIVRSCNAIVGAILMIIVVRLVRADDPGLIAMVSWYGLAYLFRAFEAGDLLFQARLDVRRLTFSRNLAYVLSSALKITGVWLGQATGFFVFLSGLEYFFGRLFAWFAYRREWKTLSPSIDGSYIFSIYREAFPQFVTLALFVLNDRLAVLALARSSGDESVGLYNAASGLLEIWNFLPLAIAASLFPPIVRAHGREPALYESRSQRFFDLMVWLGLALALGISLLGELAVKILFGEKFAGTLPVLQVLAWYQPLAFFHMARMKWFALEGRLPALLLVAVVTVGLNMYLLWQWTPALGAKGAAWSVVLSSLCAPWICALFNESVKRHMQMFMKSLFLPWRLLRGRA